MKFKSANVPGRKESAGSISIKKILRIDFEKDFAISPARFHFFLEGYHDMDKVKGTAGIRLIMFHDFLTIARLAEYLAADYNFLRQIFFLSLLLFLFQSVRKSEWQ